MTLLKDALPCKKTKFGHIQPHLYLFSTNFSLETETSYTKKCLVSYKVQQPRLFRYDW